MAAIESATITAFFLFDVADDIDLAALKKEIGGGPAEVRFVPRSGAPSYFKYAVPPLVVEGDLVGLPEVEEFRARVKFFDYGVLSIALTRSFSGDWADLIALGQRYIENEELERQAEDACRTVTRRAPLSLSTARDRWLSEDYLVFSITSFGSPMSASDLLAHRSEEIALLLSGERRALSRQEQESVLANRLSYFADDLVVPTWNAALLRRLARPRAGADLFAASAQASFRYDFRQRVHPGRPPASRAIHRRQ